MQTIIDMLIEHFNIAFKKAFPEAEAIDMELTISTQEKFGHYQCNSAMKLASNLKKNPRQIAEEIIQNLDLNSKGQKFIANLELAGPGFINIWIDSNFLGLYLENMLKLDDFGRPPPNKPKKIIIDFSSPNVAKEMHVGHLRSTIIGDSLARLLEFLGEDVYRVNHIGDWGTQFGMLIAYILEKKLDFKDASLKTLMEWYRESKKIFDEDPDFKEKAKQKVVLLQSGNTEAYQIWQEICEISRRGYEEIYQILDIKITERGESFYNPFLQDLIDDLQSKELIEESDSAKCLFLEGFFNRDGDPLPMILQKSDGGFNYASTDLAALRYRSAEEKADCIIYVTDMGQKTHFQMLFEAAKLAAYDNNSALGFKHVPFGLVLGPDGKKFKTRSGDTEKLMDLLDSAIEKSEKIFIERQKDWPKEKIKHAAKVLGIDAVKYADLSTHRCSDYQFSYERMLQLEGNTAAFLLYAFVRMSSIQRKTKIQNKNTHKIVLKETAELNLSLHLSRYFETLELIKRELCPHYLCDYLYELAQKFNIFFRDCRVIDSQMEQSRLQICRLSSEILGSGLKLLGLKTLEEM